MVITTTTIPPLIYILNSGVYEYRYVPWSEDVGTCGNFTYWTVLDPRLPVPSGITINSPEAKLEFDITNPNFKGT